MTNSLPSESNRYSRLIRMMANHFVILGYTDIEADLNGYPQPLLLGNHVPDLIARKRNMLQLLSVSDKSRRETNKHHLEMTFMLLTYYRLLPTSFRERAGYTTSCESQYWLQEFRYSLCLSKICSGRIPKHS